MGLHMCVRWIDCAVAVRHIAPWDVSELPIKVTLVESTY